MPVNVLSRLAAYYRRRFPDLKFRIVRAKLVEDFATTHADNGRFIITLDRKLPQDVACFILSHELAHGLSWHMDTEEHGPAFWAAYQKTYDEYLKFLATLIQ
jgi:hypothetical protein